MPREGYPGPGDIRLAPGVYWTRGAKGRLSPDVATALTFAYIRATARSGRLRFPPIMITQGEGYQPSPGEAHDGGGAVDLRTRHMTREEKRILISALTSVGFALYDLQPPEYGLHIHALLTHSSTLNSVARAQVARAPFKPPGKV